MCCPTHGYRDQLATLENRPYVLAEDEKYRCQCDYGNPCGRRMTQEDFLCDWCRDVDHDQECRELPRLLSQHAGYTGITAALRARVERASSALYEATRPENLLG